MKRTLRINTLAAVIGIALAGTAWQAPLQAGIAPATQAATPANQVETYIIRFAEDGLVNYRGDRNGLAATAPDATGSRKLDARAPAAVAYESFLATQRQAHVGQINATLGRNIEISHSYAITMNGIAADISAAEAARIAALPGVKSVRPAGVEYLNTYRGPTFIGADKIWSGVAVPGNVEYRGQGTVVGVIDSGAYATHPSFANDASCSLSASNPKLLSMVDCKTSSAGVCTGTNPEANPKNGHGVHTAGTAAGNTIDNTVTPPPGLRDGMTMSGVAPCAQIRTYKVCESDSCGGEAIQAGIESAIRDGVDVINFSISGGNSPWADNDRLFLDAVNADIFVAASAGNTSEARPNPVGQVAHRGPWVTTVGASTLDQALGAWFDMTGPGSVPAQLENVLLRPSTTTPLANTPDLTDAPIMTYTANLTGCTDSGGIAANAFAGSIAVLRRGGDCPFTEKANNAATAGAIMLVITNNVPGDIIPGTPGAAPIPIYGLGGARGDVLIDFLTNNPTGATADMALAVKELTGDVIANFSFRGPTGGNVTDLTKPDVTAPGVNIYAATDAEGYTMPEYEFMDGTSMSSPHVAGAALLVRGVQQDWSPIEVKSALMTTAKIAGFQEDETTPWNIDDVGSGRIQVDKAVQAGFTLDETYARFVAANPSSGSINVKDLNLPAVRNLNCNSECSFTRTVQNRLATSATWDTSFQAAGSGISATVSPAQFTLAPGASQELTITVKPPAGTTMTQIGFGHIFFTEATAQSPVQHFTVAIRGTGDEPDDLIFKDGFDTGGVDDPFFEDFDSYAANSNIHGQGGWKGWGNDPAWGATVVDSISGRSAPNSVEIKGDSDLIHEFPYSSGSWTITIGQYIPSSFSGESYYIFENVYDDDDISVVSWSTQISFDSATGMLANTPDGADLFSSPYITDRWVELKLVVDLDNDLQTFYYDGVQMFSGSWTGQYPSQGVPGVLKIGSIDLYANGATEIYYDDLQIVPTSP